jgi:hypothetical protein
MSLFASDAVFDLSPYGLGTLETLDAIRAMLVDWVGAFEEYETTRRSSETSATAWRLRCR